MKQIHCAFGLALLFLLPANIYAQSLVLQPNWWQANGTVYAITEDSANHSVYIGGDFDYVGPCNPFGTQLDSATGAPDLSFPALNGYVFASVPDGSGGWYIGGEFTKVGDSTRNNLAHINAAGIVTSWNVSTDGYINALAVYGNQLFLSGDFTTINGQARPAAGSVSLTTGAVSNWTVTTNGAIVAMEVVGNKLYVAGTFTMLQGQARTGLALLDPTDATLKAWNPETDNVVYTIRFHGNRLYAGGDFFSVKGEPRARIACIDTATGFPTSWNPSANSTVRTISCRGSNIYAGGLFSNLGDYLAAIDSSTGVVVWRANLSGASEVRSSTICGNKLLFGGTFMYASGQRRSSIVAVDLATGAVDTTFNPVTAPNEYIRHLNAWGSKVFVGGSIASIGGVWRKNLAVLNTLTGAVREWNPEIDGVVRSMVRSNNRLYIAGQFNMLQGQSRKSIAAINLSTGSVTSFNPNPLFPTTSTEITGMLLYGNRLYTHGAFNNIGGQNRQFLAALDTVTGMATAWNPDPSHKVNALAAAGPNIYVGGDFGSIGGQPRLHIAAIDTAGTGIATAWNPYSNQAVYALHADGNLIYAGGLFTNIGGEPRNKIAALDTATGYATAWDAAQSATHVEAITTYENNVYFVGMESPSNMFRPFGRAATKTTGSAVTWLIEPNHWIHTIQSNAGGVYIGGAFGSVDGLLNGTIRRGFAGFGTTSTLPVALLAFTGRNNGAVNLLNWATASEHNNHHFILEHSRDSKTFEQVATIKGAGNSKTMMHYKAIDNNPFGIVTYYRLRQVDVDGAEHVSEVISVRIKTEEAENIIVYPNPSNGYLYIDNSEGNITRAEVFDLLGRNIHTQTNTDSNSMLMNNSSWNPGVYVIHVYNNDGLLKTVKVIKN